MGETLKGKKTIELIKVIPKFPDKIITYEQKKISIKFLMNVIYKVFYDKEESLVTAEDIVEELVNQKILDNEVIGKFSDRVMKKYLWKRDQDILIRIPNIDERGRCIGRCHFYPFALVLKTENGDVYDFTSTRELYPIRLSSIFDANFEKISKVVMVNICEPPIKLKDFLESYDKEDHKIILNILIKIAKNGNMKKTVNRERREVLYNTQSELEKEVSNEFEKYKIKYFNFLPHYPEELKQFVIENRSEELEKALTYIESHRILLISGIGGVGKSTLARALVDCRPETAPRPFWFNFNHNQNAKLGDILEKLALYLNASGIAEFKDKREPGNTDVDKLIVELQRRKEIWLIFDDLSTILEDQHFADKEIEYLFYSLRYNTHNAKILITSRVLPVIKNRDGSTLNIVESKEKQSLNGLKTNFAIDYLVKNGLNEVDPKKLEILATGVDGHPFALEMLVELVNEFGVADVLEDLKMYQEQKGNINKRLVEKLAGNEKELLERISVYRRLVNMKGLKEMFTENTPTGTIKKLIDKSLLVTDHNGNYWLHPLVQEFSYEDLKDKKEAHKTAYNYYSSLILLENPSRKEDLQPSIEAHYHACKAGEYDLAADIITKSNLHYFLNLWGNSRTLVEIYEKLLSKDHFKNKPILKNIQVHGDILGNLGVAYHKLGELEKAIEYYEHALKISRETGSKQGEGECLGNLGNAYCDLGASRTAIDYYKHALRVNKEIGEKREEGANLGNLGNIYGNLGDPRKAIEYYEQALKISREIGDRRGEGNRLGNLGNSYSYLGSPREAIEYYEQALKISREVGDRQGEGTWLGNLGNAYSDLGEPKKAIEYHEQALKIAKETEDRHEEGRHLGNLGNSYSYLSEPRKAIEYYEQALKISQEIGDRQGEGTHLGNMGNAYSDLDDPKKAIEYYEQALKISREIGDRRGEGNRLGNLGNVYSHLGEPGKAIEFFKQSLAIGKAIEDPKIISFCENKLKEIEGTNSTHIEFIGFEKDKKKNFSN